MRFMMVVSFRRGYRSSVQRGSLSHHLSERAYPNGGAAGGVPTL